MTVRMQKKNVYNTSQEIIELQQAFEIWSNLTSILHGPKKYARWTWKAGRKMNVSITLRAVFFLNLGKVFTHTPKIEFYWKVSSNLNPKTARLSGARPRLKDEDTTDILKFNLTAVYDISSTVYCICTICRKRNYSRYPPKGHFQS